MPRNFGLPAKPGPDPDFWHGAMIALPLALWGAAIAAAIGLYHLGVM